LSRKNLIIRARPVQQGAAKEEVGRMEFERATRRWRGRDFARWRRRLARGIAIGSSALLVFAAAHAHAQPSAAEIDRHWQARGESLSDGFAAPGPIEAAIEGYRAFASKHPGDAVARWKLLRALHFAVDFSALDESRKAEHVREAVALCEPGGTPFEEASLDDSVRARLFFWQAIARGMQAQRANPITLLREGTATKIYEDATRALELDPTVDRGGPLRLLSRLHATLPRVPFVTGWVDRGQSIALAERAYRQDPEHPGNRLVLALALLELEPARRTEARQWLRDIEEKPPRKGYEAEDAAIRRAARAGLEASER